MYVNEKNEERNIILHGHMFKNAGTTFDWALERNFGSKFIDHREDSELIRGKEEYLYQIFLENKEIKAFSSHHLNAAFPTDRKENGLNLLPIYILREPIERVLSVYLFERKQKSDSLGAINAKKKSFREYVSWRLEDGVPATIRNFQTRYCAGHRGAGDIGEFVFNRALSTLDKYNFGLVDLFDESMVVFENYLNKYFENIDLSYIPQNVNTKINLKKEDKIEKIKDELGDIYNDLISKNNYDIKLFDYAKKTFYKRINNIDQFEDKLKAFRARCSTLA